jgi:hypothetical protein
MSFMTEHPSKILKPATNFDMLFGIPLLLLDVQNVLAYRVVVF